MKKEEKKIHARLKNNSAEKKLHLQSKKTKIKLKKSLLRHVWFLRIVLMGVVVGVFYLVFLGVRLLIIQTGADYYLKLAKDFVLTPRDAVEIVDGRTNILLLGKGGADHEAPDLTDTMMLVSISHTEPVIHIISLPRDIWVPELRAKLNSAYYWGNQKQENGGVILARSAVEEIVGVPIQYSLVVDFSVFEQVIDTVGGIEIDVEHAFIDEKYPVAGREDDECDGDPEFSCRYETIVFEKGPQFMDSTRALKFVRSRSAEGDEGTDLARGARQQKVLSALRKKVTSREVLTSPQILLDLWEIAKENTESDIDDRAAAVLARRVFESRENLDSYVLPQDFLFNPPYIPRYDNLYVFIPSSADESWNSVNDWVLCIVRSEKGCEELVPDQKEE